MKVFINPSKSPGGNPDPGVINATTGLREADAMFTIATLLSHHLNEIGIETKVFQSADTEAIIDQSNWWEADLFLSLHANSFNTKARGTASYYFETSTKGAKLAEKIQTQIVNSLGMTDRKCKSVNKKLASYKVLFETAAVAVWIDLAYIDNDLDANVLSAKADDFARAIARGITDYQASL